MVELKNLRTTLFGFGKKDVCEYIAQLNEEFSRKLNEVNKRKNSDAKQLQSKLDELENEKIRLEAEKDELQNQIDENEEIISGLKKSLESMKEENLGIRRNSDEVTDILLDVKNFANSLREKAILENDVMRRKNREHNQEIQTRLTAYKSDIGKIHENIIKMLQNMDDSLNQTTAELSAMQEKFDIEDEYNHD